MNDKKTLQDVIKRLVADKGLAPAEAEDFAKTFFDLIEEVLEKEHYIKIKGLGTFKLIDVETRESVNINTGERFHIQEHTKISFTPDTAVKEQVNRPFAHFETVVLEADAAEITETVPETPRPVALLAEETLEAEEEPQPEASGERPCTPPVQESQKEKNRVWHHRIVKALYILTALLLAGTIGYVLNDFHRMYRQNQQATADKQQWVSPADTFPATFPDTAVDKPEVCTDTLRPVPAVSLPPAQAPAALSDKQPYRITGTQHTHTVRYGENLRRIARKYYGNKELYIYIVRHNTKAIPDPDNIPVGTILQIPSLLPQPQDSVPIRHP